MFHLQRLCRIILLAMLGNAYAFDVTMKSHKGAGFFCEFNKVLGAIYYFETQGLCSYKVDWSDQFFPYKDHPTENGWDLYFDPIIIESAIKTDTAVPFVTNRGWYGSHSQYCLAPWIAYEQFFPYRFFMHEQLKRFIRIKHHILDQVEHFFDQHLKGHIVVGVHIRHAKAHAHEIPGGKRPALHHYQGEIDTILRKYPNEKIKIFMASDSHAVIDHFKNIYQSKLVSIDAFRAANEEDPHLIYEHWNYYSHHIAQWHKNKPGYWGGLTALMDCLLLSKCDYFIHTSSNMSHTVTFFNPYIKSVYLPKLTFKPCTCIPPNTFNHPYFNPLKR